MENGKVSIDIVKAEIDQTRDENGDPVYFSLTYTRQDGSVGHVSKAQKGRKDHRNKEKETKAFNHNMTYSGNILIYSHDKQAFRELNIYSLIRFNGSLIHFG